MTKKTPLISALLSGVLMLVFFGRDMYYVSIWAGLHLVVVPLLLIKAKSDAHKRLKFQDDLDIHLPKVSIGSSILAIVFITSLSTFALKVLPTILHPTPVYDLFFDRDVEDFLDELDILVRPGSEEGYLEAVQLIDERLEMPMSNKGQQELATRKYRYLIYVGQAQDSVSEKERWLVDAETWAHEWGLDSSLVNAELRANAPTPLPGQVNVFVTREVEVTRIVVETVVLTPTPGPTQTHAPTQTPLPAGYSDCHRPDDPEEEVTPAEGELLRLWVCQEGYFLVQWLTDSGTNGSFVVEEGESTRFYRDSTDWILIQVTNGQMVVTD